MSQPTLIWYRLHWPRAMTPDQLRDAAQLLASGGGAPLVVESAGRHGRVEHRLGVPARRSEAVVAQLQSKLPDLGLVPTPSRHDVDARRAVSLRLTTPLRPLRVEQAELVNRALLTALGRARPGEVVVLRWQLLAALPPSQAAAPGLLSVADVLLGRSTELDGEGKRALADKRSLPVWRAIGQVAVRGASTAREQALIGEMMAALRLAEAPGVRWFSRNMSAAAVDRVGRSWLAPLRLNTAELVAVSGWPVGPTDALPVAHRRSKLLRRSNSIASRGRTIGISTFPSDERPIALPVDDGLRHLHVLGPTGVGKSTLLLNLITSDVAAGRSVVVVEPKGDLVTAVLERIPPTRVDDVVVLEPASDTPVGLNPLAAKGRTAELVADELLGLFRSLYESSWGPRTNDILGASLLTLARTGGMSLCALPVLLTDPGFRHRVVSRLDDPIGLGPFWASFESWTEAERIAAVAPSLNRIRPFLMRPQVRAVLGQAEPRFDLGQVFSERKVLLVDLAKGAIGAEAAALLGSLVLSQLWAVAQRSPKRSPVFVYIDEFQDYLRLPVDLADALAQARGLKVGYVLAHQHLSQLDSGTRSALANARSRVCFQLAAEDARAMADGVLDAIDFRELAAFEIYAQLMAAGSVQPWCSARTLLPSTPTSNPDDVRGRSRANFGVDRRTVDAAIIEQLGNGQIVTDDLVPLRRRAGGAA
jgi:hypothetical protein